MIRARKSEDPPMDKVNLTSMTDVLLTLLILFMVLETSKTMFGFNMKLPQVVSVESPEDPTILITYTSKRDLFITTSAKGDVKIQREKLRSYLSKLRKQYKYDMIVIRADKNLKYKEVISIMDDCKRAKFDKISLATEM